MKNFITCLFCLGSYLTAIGQKGNVAIIPEPVSIQMGDGNFVLDKSSSIEIIAGNELVKKLADTLSKNLSTATGFNVPVKTANGESQPGAIRLEIIKDELIGKEGYKLQATSSSVVISANQPAGLFYGVQTFFQLLPAAIEKDSIAANINWALPACSITDYPRFGWRGLMFDVSRHFFTKEEVKKYMDVMVKYKFNLLHLGLTNDEGWRIEIKGLPKLTEVGAWNVKKVGYFGTFPLPRADEPKNYGGFYTQDDIRELLAYAKEKFINILPEINVPGHSLATVTAYPELSCSGGTGNHGVSSGESIKDWSKHIALVDDNLCPANEKVYEFLDKVITQVAQLFPFEYIHMGGDECFKTFWESSDAIKALMKKENLKTMEEVQSYFTKRVEKIVESKGKKLIGWDEILEGGLAPSAAVMSWRGTKGGIEAAKMKHEVVMSPTTFAYIDFMQGDPVIEPHVYSSLRLKKAYEFEPVPEGVDSKYIKGGQANLWTEQVYTLRHAEYMTWPRAMATAEAVWSPKDKRNWKDFSHRVEQQFKRLDEAEINYSPAMFDPSFKVSKTADQQIKVEMETEADGLEVYYTVDNSFPDRFSPKYSEAITFPPEAAMLKVITYRGKEPVGRLIYMPVDELQKRANKK